MPNTVMLGKITQVNAKNGGIKLDVGGDQWYDWSRFETGEKPALRKDMQVKVEVDNRNFLRSVTGPNGEALAAGPSGEPGQTQGGGGRWAPEDAWRSTLLACLKASASIIPRLISPDGKVGEGTAAQSPSVATYNLALYLAKRVWVEAVPEKPQDGANGTSGA